MVRRLRTLALALIGAIAGAPEPVVSAVGDGPGQTTSEQVQPHQTGGSFRALDAPDSVPALAGSQPGISQNPGGRPTGFESKDSSPGTAGTTSPRFGIRRPGTDAPDARTAAARVHHHRLLRIGAISSYSTSLPPPPRA
jgi:hypothetical protein